MAVIFLYVCIIAFVLVSALLVFTVLMQEGKGGGLSGIGGSSAIGDTFGFSNASTELRKVTRWCAVAFFILALALTFLGEHIINNPDTDFLKGAKADEVVTPVETPAAPLAADAPAAPAANAVVADGPSSTEATPVAAEAAETVTIAPPATEETAPATTE